MTEKSRARFIRIGSERTSTRITKFTWTMIIHSKKCIQQSWLVVEEDATDKDMVVGEGLDADATDKDVDKNAKI